jgi:glutamine amidotransferase
VRVAVLDLGMGNLHSVAKALVAAGADVAVTSRPADLDGCDGLCVPGQGIFSMCAERLITSGADEVVRTWIAEERPYLGICLGMQVLFDSSDEGNPNSALGGTISGPPARGGLGVLGGRVTRLPATVTVPHMGWNTVDGTDGPGEHYYFDHSYACHPANESIVRGWCDHGERFAAWIQQGSATAVQFHPEKSGRAGIDLLKRWVAT